MPTALPQHPDLSDIEIITSSEDGETLQLYCGVCDSVLCDVEVNDTLQVLVNVFNDHACSPGPPVERPLKKEN